MKNVFFGGVPTEPDVEKLRKEWPEEELEPGDIIPYDEVCSIIGVKFRQSRFRTVTNAWRKMVEEETNIIIGTEPSVGFRVLSESEKAKLSGSKLRASTRAAKRSYIVAARVDRCKLEEEEQKKLDHYVGVSAKIILAAKLRGKPILPEI
jgi:hypothetical protein